MFFAPITIAMLHALPHTKARKLGVVMIQPPSDQDRLAQMTDEELTADLNRRADALGIEITIKPKARRQVTSVPNNKPEECDR
jgi:hypothetical protein